MNKLFLLPLILLISVPILSSQAITIQTDKQIYHLGDKIIVSGTANQVPDVGIIIRAPNGNLITVDQTTAVNGIISDSFQTGGTLWNQNGNFTLKAMQGTESTTATFTLINTVPEFPTAAVVMIIIISLVILVGRISDGHWAWKI